MAESIPIAKPPLKTLKRRPNFFLRGLAILLPSVLTLWILWYAFIFVFHNVAVPINQLIRSACIHAVPAVYTEDTVPEWYRVTDHQVAQYRAANAQAASADRMSTDRISFEIRRRNLEEYWSARWHLEAAGLLVAVTLIYLAGVLLGGFLGRRLYARLERLIAQVPGFKQVYPHVKQLVEMVLGESPVAFKRVVMVQFPRPGSWMLAFVTGRSMKSMGDAMGLPSTTVFVPHTPTPFTGFTITVPDTDVIDLPISIDEALRYVITGGVLVPESQTYSGVVPGASDHGGLAELRPGGRPGFPSAGVTGAGTKL